MGADPFDNDTEDPSSTNAHLSSLWEIKTLTNHYVPKVSTIAKELFAENAMTKQDHDVHAAVSHSFESLFAGEMEWRKNQHMPLAFEQAASLFDEDMQDESVFAVC